jgi:hypothetical protein
VQIPYNKGLKMNSYLTEGTYEFSQQKQSAVYGNQ